MSFREGEHPLYPSTEEDRLEIRKQLGMKETTIQDDIDAIMDWFKKQPQLVDAGISRIFIERVLIIAKGSIESTKQRIDSFYKYRSLAPELIQNRDRDLSPFHGDLWRFYRQAAMPKLYKGHRISVFKIADPDPNNFFIDVLIRTTFMLGDMRLHHDYMLGDIWVIDIQHGVIGHLLRLNPVIMHKTAQIFQEGFGLRVSAMHVLNCPSFGNTVMNVMKQFFKPKLLGRTIFHKSLDELYEYLPKEYLPKDYGGDEPSLEEFKEMYQNEFKTERTKQFLMKCSKLISNESKRPGQIYEEHMTGSFKKLDLD